MINESTDWRGPTFARQVDAAVDGCLLGVGVDGESPVQSHVKGSVDHRPV